MTPMELALVARAVRVCEVTDWKAATVIATWAGWHAVVGVAGEPAIVVGDDDQELSWTSESAARDFIGARAGLAAVKRGRGRPRVHASDAARQAAYRERKGQSFTFFLCLDEAAQLHAYMRRHSMDGEGLSQSEVLAKLVRTQLLRKR